MEAIMNVMTVPGYTALVFFLGHIIGLPGDKTRTTQMFGAVLVGAILIAVFYPWYE